MILGKSLEDYLEAILVLQLDKSSVHSVDVADYMKFSKPSVSYAVKMLRKKGYLNMEKDGSLKLTTIGIELAQQVYERHRFFTKMLIGLGVPPEIAEQDACQIEHVISKESYDKIREKMNQN
jgi:DtxR family transcriptional regulator, Mn-dependent transcriptional regulator